jgi:hypothetical protein
LVTTTFSKNPQDLRFQLALKTCQAAKGCGYPLYIVDGSPDPGMRELLLQDGATEVAAETVKGMGASRRQVLQMGLDSGADVIVWLEPEKYPFVPLIGPCAELVGKYDIVMPARKNLDGYPKYQHWSELRAMRQIGIVTGRPDLDWFFGPRVLTRNAAELFLSYTGQAGGDSWHILVIPVLWALSRSRRMLVGGRFVDYVHPPEQSAAEEGDIAMDRKRDEQRVVLETAIEAECKKLGIHSLCDVLPPSRFGVGGLL